MTNPAPTIGERGPLLFRGRGFDAEGMMQMTERGFGECEHCGQYSWLQSHTCPPRWHVTQYEPDDPEEGYGYLLYARDPADAVRQFCEMRFRSTTEIDLPKSLLVAVEDWRTKRTLWDVSIEMQPAFSVTERRSSMK